MPSAMMGLDGLDPVRLFAPLHNEARIGIAVSGGADSLALMLLVARWRDVAPDALSAIVYSVDHGLRAEAADEVAMVRREADRLGLPSRGLRWVGDKPTSGLQAAARMARYRLIADAMATDGASVCLTAHHRRDQAETVLMRLAHGSGVEGLAGMAAWSEVEGCRLFRPLLNVDPAALRRLVVEARLVPAEDPSNIDTSYERVRWRQALPVLAELGLDDARLSTFAIRMAELDALVESALETAWPRVVTGAESGLHLRLDRRALLELPHPVGVRLLARALVQVGGGGKPHALGQVERLLARVGAEPALKRTSLHACLIESNGFHVDIVSEPGRQRLVESAPDDLA
jgi:tRNA(Ile)-lysidine synthase